jgi:hypothetical protein
MNKLAKHFLLVTPLLASCGPPSPTDDTAESAASSTLENDCASFCSVAVDCDSEEYAADWGFVAEQECVDYCVLFTNGAVKFHDEPKCEGIGRAMWVCAGMIQSCDDFEWFEAAAFGKTGLLGKPCSDELIDFSDNCN